jgi:hypothetical protein
MKKRLLFSFLICFCSVSFAQNFPGLKPQHKKILLASGMKIPLPTWLPDGFNLDTLEIKINKAIPVQDRILYVQYTKKINDTTWQSIMVEAGFDGLGSMDYKGESVSSLIGKIELYYQPYEETGNGKKTKLEDVIYTEWFEVNKVSFHVLSIVTMPGGEFEALGNENEAEDKYNYTPVSKDDFKKILQSLQVFK